MPFSIQIRQHHRHFPPPSSPPPLQQQQQQHYNIMVIIIAVVISAGISQKPHMFQCRLFVRDQLSYSMFFFALSKVILLVSANLNSRSVTYQTTFVICE